MSEIRVERDERYPFYVIDIDWRGAPVVEVSPETLARWRRVLAEFEAVQDEIHDAWQEQTDEGKRHAAWRDEQDKRLGLR